MLGLEIVRAYHREEAEVADDVLDAALGLPPGRWRHDPRRDAEVQSQYAGQSIVDLPTPYVMCRHIFGQLALTEHDVFVDLGCAAGRVVLYGAAVTRSRFRGIEIVRERGAIAQEAARNHDRVEIVIGDVLDQDLSVGTVFYAFRPFSEETEGQVVTRLLAEAARRSITVVTHRLLPSLFDTPLLERSDHGPVQFLRSRHDAVDDARVTHRTPMTIR